MKKLLNKSERKYMHSTNVDGNTIVIELLPKEIKEIQDDVADIWLQSNEISLLSDDSVEKAKDEEIARLKAELEAVSKSDEEMEEGEEEELEEDGEVALDGMPKKRGRKAKKL